MIKLRLLNEGKFMLKSVLPLSFIIASRFLGLFIVLPVLSLYALNLEGANEFLVGLIVGVYAISQMIFQVPFGALSDKIGRKKALTIGLLVFVVGSIVCALSSDIYTMLFGRFLQGIGAVGAVATAMISDFVTEENRSKAMAIMGAFIGLSFTLSMVLGPLLARSYGLSSLFYFSAALSLLCVVLLYTVVPKEIKVSEKAEKVPFGKLFLQKDYMIINFTSFMQKMLTSIAFLAIPIILVKEYGYESGELYKVYTLGAVLGFLAMGLAGFLGDGKGLSKVILIAFCLLIEISVLVMDTEKIAELLHRLRKLSHPFPSTGLCTGRPYIRMLIVIACIAPSVKVEIEFLNSLRLEGLHLFHSFIPPYPWKVEFLGQ